jgi:hypothetical protein
MSDANNLPDWLEAEAQEARQDHPSLTQDQCRLYALMSDISEDCYCAGWMSGNEYRLWRAVADPSDDLGYGMQTIDRSNVRALQHLSDRAGGWIYWHDDDWEPGLPSSHWGPRCMSLDKWMAHVAASAEAKWYGLPSKAITEWLVAKVASEEPTSGRVLLRNHEAG